MKPLIRSSPPLKALTRGLALIWRVPRRLPPQAGEARLADAVHALIAAWSFDLEPKAYKVLKHGFKITWPKDMQVGMNFN